MSERIRKQPKIQLSNLILVFSLIFSGSAVFAADPNSFRERINQRESKALTTEDILVEVNMGRQVSARILKKFPLSSSENINRYINLVGQSIVLYSARDDMAFHFSLIESEQKNAYSTPGGYVFITTGLVKSLQDESELAAVLAHEIAHVTNRHIAKEFKLRGKDKSAIAGLSRILSSSQNAARAAFQRAVDGAELTLFQKGFKQSDELEADYDGILMLAAAGYDPYALVRYLESSHHSESPSLTHPSTPERTEALMNVIQEEDLDDEGFARAESRFKQTTTTWIQNNESR